MRRGTPTMAEIFGPRPKPLEPDQLPPRYSREQVLQFFGVPESTLRRWMKDGWIEFYKHGRRPVFSREQILEAERRMSRRSETR